MKDAEFKVMALVIEVADDAQAVKLLFNCDNFRGADMTTSKLSSQVNGKTIRLSWTDGPTKGTTQEHVFYKNGTVEWHSIEKGGKTKAATGSGDAKAAKKPDKPPYAAMKVTDDICVVSYLAQSGYTLTVVLNFLDNSTVAIASNQKDWLPSHGTFELMS